MKKFYESPELLLAKYEVDESIAALSLSGPFDDATTEDKDSWDNMFGGN